MVSQFLYGRRRNGYTQIGNVENMGYGEEDVSGFQLLWNYELAEGCDDNSRPECKSFYVAKTSKGPVAQIGRTAFVPAGTSMESGDRDTTLLHKYLFSDSNYRLLVKNSDVIFKIQNFCETVEDALQHEKGRPSYGELEEGESVRELLEYFRIPEECVEDFMYGVLDSVGNMDSRVYIALPEWNSEGTRKAFRLCQKLLACFPPFLVSACGFLTYTKTFHNSQTNMIPRTVKVIFFPNNQENVRKYGSISANNYIVDSLNGYLPVMETDDYTRDLIRAFATCFLTGKRDNSWYMFFDSFGPKLPWDALFFPENLSCAFKFLQLLKELNYGWPVKFSIDEMYYIIENFLNCKAFSTLQDLSMNMLYACERVMPIGGDLLNIFCDYYMLMPSAKQVVVHKICELLEGFSADENQDLYQAVLNYEYEDPRLGEDVAAYVYQDPDFYRAAIYREELTYHERIKQMDNWEEIVEAVYNRYDGLSVEAPDFLLDYKTVTFMNAVMESLCFDIDGRLYISLEKLGYLYGRDWRFRKEREGFEALSQVVISIVSGILEREHLKHMKENEVKEVLKWLDKLEEDSRMPDLSYQILYLKSQKERFDYLEFLRQTDGDACVEFWKERGMENSRSVMSRMRFNIYEIADRMKFESRENYNWFYGIMFLIWGDHQIEILRLVMEDNGSMGGVQGLSGVWGVVKGVTQDKLSCRKLMKAVVEEYYNRHEVTAADLREMKCVKDFMTAIHADSYLNDASVIGRLKNLGNLGGKPQREKGHILAGGRMPKDKR